MLIAMDIAKHLGDYHAFFAGLCEHLNGVGIDIADLPVSHLNYRTTTIPEYERLRDTLSSFCKEYVETQFNGRAVAILELQKPILLADSYQAPVVELPAPRAAHMYPSGIEHIGFVVDDLPAFKQKYAPILTGEKHRPYTVPAFITFDDGKTGKFYERSLKEIVKLQGWKFEKV